MIFTAVLGEFHVAFARQCHAAEFDTAQMPVTSLTRSEVEVKAMGGVAAAGHFC